MKQLKGVIIVLAGLFVMITLLSLLMPSRVMTARSVEIHADPSYIFTEINDLNNWKHWHPVFTQDSNNIHISNVSSGLHASATWQTNGKENTLEITEAIAYSIKLSLMRRGENNVDNIISVAPVKDSSAVQVEWRVLTKLKWYPWEKFYGIFVDKITGPGYELALNNLKEFVENNER